MPQYRSVDPERMAELAGGGAPAQPRLIADETLAVARAFLATKRKPRVHHQPKLARG